MKKNKLFSPLIFIFIIATIILTGCGSNGYRSLKIYDVSGSVNILREEKTIDASKNMKLKNDDTINVLGGSSAVLKLDNDKYIMAKENTTLKLEATGKKKNTKTRILVNDGGVIVEVKEKLKEKESFEIASSNSVMAIRGTRIGFDVEKTDETISTNLVTLTGKTEIMLLKDNNLKSTALTECLSLTYESNINECKDINEMSSLIENSTVDHISDEDLKDIYKTEIREISTYEIDSIVDAVNKFERKINEYINGTIKITDYPTKVEYGTDPKDLISVDKDYKELNFYYSKEVKGDYLRYDSDTPLTPGTWYCKAKSIDAYRSDPFEFEVVEKEIKFKSEPKEVDYATDPKNVFLLDGSYKDIEYYYSKTIDGEYKIYNENDPLELGKWYFMAKCLGHKSQIYEIEVTKIKVSFNFDIVQKSYSGTASLDITLNDNNLFDKEFASIVGSNNENTIYENYISMKYSDSDNNDYYIYFDKDNKNEMLDYIFSGEKEAKFTIEYNLPYYYEVTSSNNLTYNFKNSIDMDKTVIICKQGKYFSEVYKYIDINLSNYYAIDEESKVKVFFKRVADLTGEVTYVKVDDLYIDVEGNETLVIETYEFDGVNKNKGYYEYDVDFSYSEKINTASIECNSMFLTYNDNETMNVYFDIVYSSPSADVMSFVTLTTNDSRSVEQKYMEISNNTRFTVFEDVLITDYHVSSAHAVIKYNGVCYSLGTADIDYSYINPKNDYYYNAKYEISGDVTTIKWEENSFDTTSPIVIHADDKDFIINGSNNSFNEYTINGVFNSIKLDGNYYSIFFYTGNAMHKTTFDFDEDKHSIYLTDYKFGLAVKEMKEKYGIIVKGSNKYNFKGLIAEERNVD